MNRITDDVTHEDVEPKPGRQPLGSRDKNDVRQTLLRVIGNPSAQTVLEVAAFQSFAE